MVRRWERVTDTAWVIQTGVGQPTETAESRFLDDRWLFRDSAAVFNPRHAYTEHVVDLDLVVPGTQARIAHTFEIADGIDIDVEQGGELLVL